MDLRTKTCGRCRRDLLTSEFNVDRHAKSGLRSQCKECMTLERSARRDQAKAWRGKPEVRAWYRAYRVAGGERERLQRAARNAARALPRQPCEKCGAQKAHAHHDDYSKPLVVRWLCPADHVEWHRNNDPIVPDQSRAA
jgi:hypothetical protein